jgi:Tol biopolymer transport system component
MKDGNWGTAVPLPPPVNSEFGDSGPCISADGLSLYFASDRPGTHGSYDIWVTTRPALSDPWGEPINLGLTVNSEAYDNHPSISTDGLTLYFDSRRTGGLGSDDIWVTTRTTTNDPWGEPVNLGPTINTNNIDLSPNISSESLTFFFDTRIPDRDIWMTTRRTSDDDWGSPVNLGPPVNTSDDDTDPSICVDGSMLYFASYRPGGVGRQDLWQVSIEPVVDLNGDGLVDCADMSMMVDHWGEDYPLCDIGPMPWGDGIVDVQDLIVLSGYFTTGVITP